MAFLPKSVFPHVELHREAPEHGEFPEEENIQVQHLLSVRMTRENNTGDIILQVVNTDVIAEGVIDSSHHPIDLVQFLSQPAHLS